MQRYSNVSHWVLSLLSHSFPARLPGKETKRRRREGERKRAGGESSRRGREWEREKEYGISMRRTKSPGFPERRRRYEYLSGCKLRINY